MTILPDLVDFVIAILPVILVVIIVGFIATFFDSIVGMIRRL